MREIVRITSRVFINWLNNEVGLACKLVIGSFNFTGKVAGKWFKVGSGLNKIELLDLEAKHINLMNRITSRAKSLRRNYACNIAFAATRS